MVDIVNHNNNNLNLLINNRNQLINRFNQINQDNKSIRINDFNYKNKFNFDKKIDSGIAPYPLPEIPKDYFLLLEGYGAGHGVGMSQWGARAMAERGASFRNILKHYYTGVQIKTY